jgi:signal peptidase
VRSSTLPREKEIVKSIIEVIVIFAVVFIIANYGLRFLLGVKYPLAVPTSNSMYPTLKKGDLLIVTKADPYELKEGDIIVFQASWASKPVVHRIIRIEWAAGSPIFYTKGDANSHIDLGYRTVDDIIGIVKYRVPIPKLGEFLTILQNRWIRITLIGILGYLLIEDIIKGKEEQTIQN